MLNTYQSLTAAQVKAMTDAFNQSFNAEQLKSFLIAIDSYVGSGGAPATATVRGNVLRAASVGTVTSPNATDLATAQTLANELKTDLNALIASLQAAGVLA